VTLAEALLTAIGAETSALIWVVMKLLAVLRELAALEKACAAEKQALNDLRIQDQKAATVALLTMTDKTHGALDKVAEVLEAVRHAPAQPYLPSRTTGTR
jgi:hypothetical protein